MSIAGLATRSKCRSSSAPPATVIAASNIQTQPGAPPSLAPFCSKNPKAVAVSTNSAIPTRSILALGALAMLAATDPGTGIEWLIAASFVLGIGAGCLITPLSVLTFLTVVPESRTDAAGLYNLARQLGGALGVAGVTAVVATVIPAASASSPHAVGEFSGYYLAFFLLIVLAMLAIPAVSMFRVGTVERSKPAESGSGAET